MFFFFFNDTATTEIYTLSLHDALPIFIHLTRAMSGKEVSDNSRRPAAFGVSAGCRGFHTHSPARKEIVAALAQNPVRPCPRSEEHTSELQSQSISYAVFCLKKKNRRLTSLAGVPSPSSVAPPRSATLLSGRTPGHASPPATTLHLTSLREGRRATTIWVSCGT